MLEFEARRRHLWATVETAAETTRRIESMLVAARRAEDLARDTYEAHLQGIPAELAKQYAEREAARVAAALSRIEARSEARIAADIAQQMIERAKRLVETARVSTTQSDAP